MHYIFPKPLDKVPLLWYNIDTMKGAEIPEERKEKEKMKTAKMLGYKVIDEFGLDIASRVYLKIDENWELKIIDEFGLDITKRVRLEKEN